MTRLKASTLFILLSLALAAGASAQAPGRYDREGLSFDYPEGWTLVDNSSAELQSVSLTRPGTSTLVSVFAGRRPVTTAEQLFASRNSVTLPYVAKVARGLGMEKPPPPYESECIPVGGHNAVGFRMAGRVKGEPTTAEVFTIVLGRRLLHLVHVSSDKDAAQSAVAWKSVLDTLKVEAPPDPSPEDEKIKNIVMGGVLNGRALKKPEPDYPSIAKAARASGVVSVLITVDEKGDVTSAEAVAGHPLLRKAGEEAARRAKFSPTTLCGRPVQVTGVISYGFVL